MNNRINKNVANSILWAAAILTSAILGAPAFLTLIILPMLGFMSVLNQRKAVCGVPVNKGN